MARYIDADALMAHEFKNDISYKAFCNLVKRQPTADVAPVRHGRWVDYVGRDLGIEGQWRRNDGKTVFIQCSECDALVVRNLMVHMSFCPCCGAQMDGGAIGDPMEDDLK